MKARDSVTGQFKDVYVKALDGNPIGTILPYSKSTAPTGYMICDGSAISRTTYAELFSIIGTTFGDGDGSTTFNIPNLKGRVPVGYDSTQTEFDTLGETGGEKKHTLTTNEIPSHSHGIGIYTPNGSSGNWAIQYNTNAGVKLTTDTSGGGQAHNILQPYLVLNYIIKVSQTRPLSATVVNEYNDSQVNAYSTEYVNDLSTYSTTEQRVGTWIDGKPIYRKVIEGTINSTGSYQTILTDSTIDTLTDIGGNIKDSGNSIQYIIGKSIYRDGTNTSRIIKVSSNIRLDYSDQFHSLPFKAIIEYTKTTD